MAKKTEKKVVLERTYKVPLRKEFQRVALYKRAKKATKALREFLCKNMRSEKVLIGKYLNEAIWVHGIKNPPHHVTLVAKKYDDGTVMAELANAPVAKASKKDAKKAAKKTEKKVIIKEKNVEKPDNLEVIKEQKELKEETKAEEDIEELEKEELGNEEAMEEEADIKESIDDIDKPKKAKKTVKK